MKRGALQISFALLILWLGLIFSYWETFSYDYVDFDDPEYLLANPLVKLSLFSPDFWGLLFNSSTVNLWHPLTVLSHQVMVRLTENWGAHHALNLLLHGATATLLGGLLYRAVGKSFPAIVATLIFAWHPVTTESVAWLSGRKDLLCAIFVITSLLLHVRWVDTERRSHFYGSLLIGGMAMACKPLAFLVPCILLLLDFWPLKRKLNKALLVEKLVWLVPSSLTVALTLFFQSAGNQSIEDSRTIFERFSGALWAFEKAVTSILVPNNLHLSYQDPQTISLLKVFMILICILVFLMFSLRYFKRAGYLVIGFTFFVIFLAPTLGLIRAGNHLAADRYSYLPLMGVSLMIAGLLAHAVGTWRRVLYIIPILLLFLQKQQVSSWESLESLAGKTLKGEPRNPTANSQLGYIFHKRGDEERALGYLGKTLEASPSHVGANLLSADIAQSRKEWATAEAYYLIASEVRSNDYLLWKSLGYCQLKQKKYDEGVASLQKAFDSCEDVEFRQSLEIEIQSITKQINRLR